MSVVSVSLGPDSYDLHVESGILDKVGGRLVDLLGRRRIAVITDDNVRRHYAASVLSNLKEAGHDADLVTITPGEKQKNLRTAEKLYDRFFDLRMDRHSIVVALGGGVVGDLAGFVAATFMRGIGFVQLPTSLVAQVDSSIGGKTGVDRPQGKNTVGCFYQPKAVYIDPPVLRTLPREEFAAGMAEVIKHGIIADADLFTYLETHVDDVLALKDEALEMIIRRSCEIKADVVTRDEKEEGLRSILNFGHTFGHAIEAATGYRTYRHGEAVAIGMVMACELGVTLGMFSRENTERVRALIEKYGLPESDDKADPTRAMRLLSHDKKAQRGRPKLILPTDIGQVVTRTDIAEDAIATLFEQKQRPR